MNFCHNRKRLKSTFVYKQSDINQVMKKLDLLEIISEYVPLKKTRTDYIGKCPFCRPMTNNDRHFRVSSEKSLYKCFECGAGGKNAISFLMRYFNKPFDEVFRFVNNKYVGIKLVPDRTSAHYSRCIDDGLPF